jgi:hypothetical protein
MNKDYYFSVVKKNVVEISEANPDIAIRAEKKIVGELYRSGNVKEKVLEYYNKGFIGVDIVASVKTLALKGYISLYKYFSVTGNAILGERRWDEREIVLEIFS